jgi:hypothetical protein
MDSVVYSLYLNTSTDANRLDYSNLANVKWLMNWDDLFKGANYEYDKCRLRYSLVSLPVGNGVFQFLNNAGFLQAGFVSNYTSTANPNTVLGLIYPVSIGTDTNLKTVTIASVPPSTGCNAIVISTPQGNIGTNSTATQTTTGYNTQVLDKAFIASTMNEQGINITPPVGTQPFTIQFKSLYNSSLQENVQNYQIFFTFELYDKKQMV